MINIKHVIIGCGDVGKRIASQLMSAGEKSETILGIVFSEESQTKCKELGIEVNRINFDQLEYSLTQADQTNCYYLVPPQKSGDEDLRSRNILNHLQSKEIKPSKLVLISTTGVYGDCNGEWVTEQSLAKPETGRGKRRLDAETQWSKWCQRQDVNNIILRVPGIYANSRLPRQRLEQKIPVVRAKECGFTNRIHADDLAAISITAMQSSIENGIYNATDGSPGKITEYLQAAAQELNLPPLPEISMQEAQQALSSGMLSYLSESRKISNQKMLDELDVKLRYPNFRDGLKFG